MIKTMLVALDGSEQAGGAASGALWLARRLDATVVGIHVIDVVSIEGSFFHDISGSLGFEPYLDFSSKMREALEARGTMLLEDFAATCGKQGVRAETTLTTGIVANQICSRARTADLIVMGHRGINARFTTGMLGSTAESVTRKSPCPVLVAPGRFDAVQRPLLAYDGSDRSSAALHAAAEFCRSLALPLTVLHVNRDEGAGRSVLDEAARYLAAYDLSVECELVSGAAHESIVTVLGREHFDLIFIGAFGHSRIVEMVLGSTTEFVLRNSPVPVFLSR
jgi:nucleotide-binding universal stress UspA family protein